jgi:GNAT superfamily N-acetyltransferase
MAGEPGAEEFIDLILPGVHSAGTPYDDWLFGGPDEARAALRDSMLRPSSEVFIGRVTLCMAEGVVVGGIIPLGGAELAACRMADAVATVKLATPEARRETTKRVAEARKLFPPVRPDDFYLSRLWVSTEWRGSGHGPALLREYLASGRRTGFRRFTADICSTNVGVLRLAQFFKFQMLGEAVSDEAHMAYIRILIVDGEDAGMPADPTEALLPTLARSAPEDG